VFAFPKAGSVLVNQVARALMAEIGVPVVDLPQYAFDHGISLESIICNIDNLFKDLMTRRRWRHPSASGSHETCRWIASKPSPPASTISRLKRRR
jgi:hypothetical protein